MTDPEILAAARQRVADRFSELLRPGILRGDWDRGALVHEAVEQIEGERK